MAKKNCFKTGALLLILSTSLCGCAGLLDGPLNQNGVMVPALLYANNNSGYVTYWDDESNSYRTYDQVNNIHLQTVAYDQAGAQSRPINRDRLNSSPVRLIAGGRGASQNYRVAGPLVMPQTHLNRYEMDVQIQQGCSACHKN